MFRFFVFAILAVLSVVDMLSFTVPQTGSMVLLAAVVIYVPPEEIAEGIPAAVAVWLCCGLTALICRRLGKTMPFGLGDIKVFSILSLALPLADLLAVAALSSIYSGIFDSKSWQ